MILYEYQGNNPIDPNNLDEGTYPVYRIVLPNTARFLAGTYQYTLFGINRDQRSCVYPISVLNALEIMEHESPVSSAKDKTQLLKDIQDSFNKMAIWMSDDDLQEFLIKEYQMNGIEDTSTIDKDLETLKKGIGTNKAIDEKERKNKKKEIHYESDGSVDIWWGSSEKDRKNGFLSNLAPRKVKFNNITYPSVEAAFQAQKLSYSAMPNSEKKLVLLALQASDGALAKQLGKDKSEGGSIEKLNVEAWDKAKDQLMHDIIKASFEQNKEDRELLLSTKDAKLTHNKASIRDEWRTKFPEILTQVRTELKAEQKNNKKSETEEDKNVKIPKTIDISKDENYKSLNNTALRHVTINGLEFPTVMHAYNYAIISAADIDNNSRSKYQQALLDATDMQGIRQIVDEVVAIAGKKPLEANVLDSLLYKLMYMSFEQNPESVEVLLSTENAEFKGVSDKVADNLEKIRDKFREKEENDTDDEEFDEGPEEVCTGKNK